MGGEGIVAVYGLLSGVKERWTPLEYKDIARQAYDIIGLLKIVIVSYILKCA